MFEKENFYDNDSLLKEAQGLKLLQNCIEKTLECKLKIPKLYYVDKDILKLEKIPSSYASSKQMQEFGKSLANLHKVKYPLYGLDYDNYIGLSTQKNILSSTWGDFFFRFRLLYQVEMIKDKEIKKEFLEQLLKFENTIISFLDENCEYASILHGDLWAGNVLFSKKYIYLIDPAVYYGDKEVDLAMTQMFGGFSELFYSEYFKTIKVSKEYEKKKIIYNLYHYLNHYNIFGSSYLNSCKRYIKAFEKLFVTKV